jgi:hypothetical protein
MFGHLALDIKSMFGLQATFRSGWPTTALNISEHFTVDLPVSYLRTENSIGSRGMQNIHTSL